MKITIFLGSLGGGGAERVTCSLANYLCNRGHEIEILTMSDADAGYSVNKKVKRTCLLSAIERKNIIFDNVRRINRLRKHMRSRNIDVYVVLLPATTILMLLFSGITDAKIIAAERANPESYPKVTKFLLKLLAYRADRWIFQTEEIKNWYDSCSISARSVVIPNPICDKFDSVPYKGIREKRVVGVGRLTKEKNFKLLIDAFAIVYREYTDYCLEIYGDGGERAVLDSYVRELGLENVIRLPGYTREVREIVKRSTVFVLSSDNEGMPNALIEAMALGVPCISTDCGGGGAKFLIKNGENGIIVPTKDVNGLASAIINLLSNESKASLLGKKARKIVEALDSQKIFGKWEQTIEETGTDSNV